MPAIIHTPPCRFYINVNGIDCTDKFNPYLIKLTIVDDMGDIADRCEITLDDTDGQIVLPEPAAKIIAGIGWQDTGPIHSFEGYVDAPGSIGSRESGRLLVLSCGSVNPVGKVKQTQNEHLDKMSFKDAAQKFGALAGLNVNVDDMLAKFQRDYWSMGNESYMQWGARTARWIGATFKIAGDNAAFIDRNSNKSTGGQDLPTIDCEVGVNVIRWSITPTYLRPQFSKFATRLV